MFDNIVKALGTTTKKSPIKKIISKKKRKKPDSTSGPQRFQTGIKISFVFYLMKHGFQSN